MSEENKIPMADQRWSMWGSLKEVEINGSRYRVRARYHPSHTGIEAGPLKWWQRLLYHAGDKLHQWANRGLK